MMPVQSEGGDNTSDIGGGGPIGGLAALLARSAEFLGGLWPDRPGYAEHLGELRARLVEQRLQIAVLGQFKRGKSTFLNALLGQPVLPTGVLPLTAIPTFIRWAPASSVKVTYLDGRTEKLPATDLTQITGELFRLVTEEGNPHNQANVARVDLAYAATILSQGIILIDTPGIGSTFRHNTDAAIRVLPACDAAFFVLSADPPVTAVELEYLDRVRPAVARLFFILNKIDYLSEPDRTAASEFLRRSLFEHMPAEADIAIFSVSARQGLEAKQAGDARGVAESGLAAIERYLAQFLARDKNEALQRAVSSKAAGLLDAAQVDIALGIRALEMPIEDLERRAAQFSEALREIERQRLVARDLLAGDRRRCLDALEGRAAALREEARSTLIGAIDRALGADQPIGDIEGSGKDAIADAIPEFFGPKMEELSRVFGAEVEAMLAQQVEQAGRLIAAVRETAAALFEIPSIPAAGSDSFVMSREAFWVTQKFDETLASLAGGALDKLLPTSIRASRIRNRLAAEIDELVERNVENLRWATLQNLEEAFRRFSSWFDERLAETIGATRGAIEAALVKRRENAQQAQDELARLRHAADWIAATQRNLADLQRPLSTTGQPGEMVAAGREE